MLSLVIAVTLSNFRCWQDNLYPKSSLLNNQILEYVNFGKIWQKKMENTKNITLVAIATLTILELHISQAVVMCLIITVCLQQTGFKFCDTSAQSLNQSKSNTFVHHRVSRGIHSLLCCLATTQCETMTLKYVIA